MGKTFDSTKSIEINASKSIVWRAITDPALVKQWFLGTKIETNWQVGGPITFKGEWQGNTYEDKGTIQQLEPEKLLQYTHWSSRTGEADMPENYEVVTFTLTESAGKTTLTIHEIGLKSAEARDTSTKMWSMILGNLKQVTESLA